MAPVLTRLPTTTTSTSATDELLDTGLAGKAGSRCPHQEEEDRTIGSPKIKHEKGS